MNKAEQYIHRVLHGPVEVNGKTLGRIVAGKYIKKVLQRHVDDLADESSDFYFDKEHAERYIKAIEIMPFAKGKLKGQPFQLQLWQATIVYILYGWKRKINGCRRYTKLYLKVARKGGKTEFLSALAMLGMTIDSVPGAEIYWAATKREQAKIGWKRQKTMMDIIISRSLAFANKFGTNTKKIFAKFDDLFSTALGRDSNTEDGLMIYYGIVDEYHAHKDNGMVKILETGTGSFEEPLILIITTAGYNVHGPCKEFENICQKILDEILENDEILPFIYNLDEDDDWKDPKNWGKANPGLGVSPTMRSLKSGYKSAITEGGSSLAAFLTKQLNMWVSGKSKWISVEKWRKCYAAFSADSLTGRTCFGGIDLGKSSDTCAFVLLFPPVEDGEKFKILSYFWTNEEAAEKQKDVNYVNWETQGYITIADGDTTDYNDVKRCILQACEKFNVEMIGYDPFNSSQMVIDLTNEGVDMQPFSQSRSNMNTPIRETEELINSENLEHNGNRCMNWQIDNVETRVSEDDLVKIIKSDGQNKNKVDGPVSLVISKGEYLTWLADQPEESPYETRGVRTIKRSR